MGKIRWQWWHILDWAGMIKSVIAVRLNQPARYRQLKILAHKAAAGEIVVVFYPDYRKHNPHQQQLADAMPKGVHCQAGTIGDALFLQSCVCTGVTVIFHLHWPDPVLRGLLFPDFIKKLKTFKQRGGRVLWSIHNLYPRNTQTESAIARLQMIGALVDRFHLYTPAYKDNVIKTYGLAEEKCVVAPHGHYIGHYPNNASSSESRDFLSIAPEKFVLCFFGQLRPYKGLDALVDAYVLLHKLHVDAEIIIAGKQRLKDYFAMRAALNQAKKMPGVHLHAGFIADEHIQYFMNSADVIVLPYNAVMNSGAFILAASFGRCIVAPAAGAIAEMATTHENAILYDPEDSKGLEKTLLQVAAMPREKRAAIGAGAMAMVQSLRWEDSANVLYQAMAVL